ncbi:hypothetical protein HanRHA438_Chr10g0454751 [Helianthus annuus]|nr:hypothetical protein HanIR_Chr10g0477161 [Helianthus annuus]KAJ0879718.1 hypothetical protein HanRHA438_Chr10g0454751 [Helianthus annuus]
MISVHDMMIVVNYFFVNVHLSGCLYLVFRSPKYGIHFSFS